MSYYLTLKPIDGFPDPPLPQWGDKPALPQPSPEVIDLPGPASLNGVTYASHHITLYVYRVPVGEGYGKHRTGIAHLVMRMYNGAGASLFEIDSHLIKSTIDGLLPLAAADPLVLYAFLYELWDTQQQAQGWGAQDALHDFKRAFVEGKLKKTKRNGSYYITIEQPIVDTPKPGGEVISRGI